MWRCGSRVHRILWEYEEGLRANFEEPTKVDAIISCRWVSDTISQRQQSQLPRVILEWASFGKYFQIGFLLRLVVKQCCLFKRKLSFIFTPVVETERTQKQTPIQTSPDPMRPDRSSLRFFPSSLSLSLWFSTSRDLAVR